MLYTRRSFLANSTAASLAASHLSTTVGRYAEITLRTGKKYVDPFRDVQVDVSVRSPEGKESVAPTFWAGDGAWRARITGNTPGTYTYRTIATDSSNSDLHGHSGSIAVHAYEGQNPLLRHGALRVSGNRRFLEHTDGMPFFWLGDTWWMGLVKRLRWPEDFRQLAADRVAKGFNIVQIVAGLYPDMPGFDPRGENEAGFPWQKDYATINPAYFDMADLRIQHLVDAGLMPCVVGCWGYYLPWLGQENMKLHWRYLIARWGALPVVWCLAGEGSMPWYLTKNREEDTKALEVGWTEMAKYVRQTDPYRRLITIHPSRAARDVVRDASVIDFDMLQTGHSDYKSLPNTVRQMVRAYEREPRMPVLNAEVCYEGILERSRQDVQRQMFWASVLNGGCGHTYGANGIWQVNLPDKPFGASPGGNTWGNTPWQEAADLPGGRQLGAAAKWLRTLPWQRMEPRPDWIRPRWGEEDFDRPYAAGIPGELRLIYVPLPSNGMTLTRLESGVPYRMSLFHPGTAEIIPFGEAQGNEAGEFVLPRFPHHARLAGCSSARLDFEASASNPLELAAISFGRATFSQPFEFAANLSLFRDLASKFLAFVGLPVQCLRDGGRTSHLAQDQHFDLKIAAVSLHMQHVADANFSRWLGRLIVRLNPPEFASARRYGTGFEESRGPQPLVHSHAVHTLIVT